MSAGRGRRWIERWNAYWFPTTPTLHLAICRIVAVGTQLVLVLPRPGRAPEPVGEELGVHRAAAPDPRGHAAVVPRDLFFTPDTITLLYWVTAAAGVAGAGGPLHPDVAVPLRAGHLDLRRPPLLLWRPAPHRGAALHLPHAAATRAVGRAAVGRCVAPRRRAARTAERPETSDLAIWPLKVAHVLFALTYFSAGISKLIHSGPRWLNGYTLQGHTFGDADRAGTSAGHLAGAAAHVGRGAVGLHDRARDRFFASLFPAAAGAALHPGRARRSRSGCIVTAGYDFFPAHGAADAAAVLPAAGVVAGLVAPLRERKTSNPCHPDIAGSCASRSPAVTSLAMPPPSDRSLPRRTCSAAPPWPRRPWRCGCPWPPAARPARHGPRHRPIPTASGSADWTAALRADGPGRPGHSARPRGRPRRRAGGGNALRAAHARGVPRGGRQPGRDRAADAVADPIRLRHAGGGLPGGGPRGGRGPRSPTWERFGAGGGADALPRRRARGATPRGCTTSASGSPTASAGGLVRDLGAELGGVEDARPLRFMTEHRASYAALADDAVYPRSREHRARAGWRGHGGWCRPSASRPVADRIESGDVLAFATAIPGLDVTHAAFAYRDAAGHAAGAARARCPAAWWRSPAPRCRSTSRPSAGLPGSWSPGRCRV